VNDRIYLAKSSNKGYIVEGRESQNDGLPSLFCSLIYKPSASVSSGRLFSVPENLINETYKGYQKDTYLDKIRISNHGITLLSMEGKDSLHLMEGRPPLCVLTSPQKEYTTNEHMFATTIGLKVKLPAATAKISEKKSGETGR
jgi:hypothetical protein